MLSRAEKDFACQYSEGKFLRRNDKAIQEKSRLSLNHNIEPSMRMLKRNEKPSLYYPINEGSFSGMLYIF